MYKRIERVIYAIGLIPLLSGIALFCTKFSDAFSYYDNENAKRLTKKYSEAAELISKVIELLEK